MKFAEAIRDPNVLTCLIAPATPHGYLLVMKIAGTEVCAQVDTGAWDNLFPRRLAEQLALPKSGSTRVLGVVGDAKLMPTYGPVRAEMYDGLRDARRRIVTNFVRLLSTDLNYVLLGRPFLSHFEISTDRISGQDALVLSLLKVQSQPARPARRLP